jgi:hypothetical protein
MKKESLRPGQAGGPQTQRFRLAVLAYGIGGSRPPGVRGQSGRLEGRFMLAAQA